MADINLDGGGYWGSASDTIPKGQLPQAPDPSAPNVPAPGNDANQIQGWGSKFLGRTFSDADISKYFAGQPLDTVMHDIANSPEADAYNKANKLGNYATPAPAQPSYGTNVFDDPATANFEQLLNGVINQFNAPKVPPDYQQSIDQLNGYLKQLNGPTYTPEQMGILQTQALDPINQQHDQARQQTIQRLAAQGIGPSSGITQQALQTVDQQFEQMRTQTQNQFATNAVGLSRQNAATAAQLAPMLSNYEYQNMTAQDPRNLQAVTLASMIPQMAMQRLQTAQGGLTNPATIAPLLSLLQSFQNNGYNQGANYGGGIAQLLAALFGLGG